MGIDPGPTPPRPIFALSFPSTLGISIPLGLWYSQGVVTEKLSNSDGLGTALPVSLSRWFGPVSEWVVVKTALSVSRPPPLVSMTTGKTTLSVSVPGGGETALTVLVSVVVRQHYLFLPLGHL